MVPEGWKIKALSDIAAVERGKFSARPRNDPQYYGGAIPFIQTGDVATSGGHITSYAQTLNERGLAVSRLFRKGTIFITIAANIGNAAIADFDTACPDSIVAVQPADSTSVIWLLHMLMLEQRKLDACASQNAQKNINLETLRPLPILTPPNGEQHRIATILSTWDLAIAQTERLIEAKRKIKKGLMQQLLAGKRRFPGFRSKWKEQRLAELAEYHNGRTFKPEDWGDQGLPIIRIQNLNGSMEFNYYNGPYDKKYLVRDGDLLFSWLGSRGTSFGSFVWRGPNGLLNQHIFKVVPIGQVTQSYLGYLLRYVTNLIEQKAHGSAGLVHITKRELERFPVHFPSDQEEQQKIAAVLYAADQEINALSHLSNQLKEQKRGLMQKLLTGQIRVKATAEITA